MVGPKRSGDGTGAGLEAGATRGEPDALGEDMLLIFKKKLLTNC